jgi:general stress protein YciG
MLHRCDRLSASCSSSARKRFSSRDFLRRHSKFFDDRREAQRRKFLFAPPVQQHARIGCLSGSDLDEPAGVASRDSLRKMGECSMAERNQSSSSGSSHRGGSGNFAEDRERASEAGRKGGEASGGNFANDPERAAEAGRKGGEVSGGNFANDPERAAEAGRKGGEASGGNFANDPERAAEAGRKGGQSRSG